jgi:hypothetical protein
MATGYQEISTILEKHKKVTDFRTAAFILRHPEGRRRLPPARRVPVIALSA